MTFNENDCRYNKNISTDENSIERILIDYDNIKNLNLMKFLSFLKDIYQNLHLEKEFLQIKSIIILMLVNKTQCSYLNEYAKNLTEINNFNYTAENFFDTVSEELYKFSEIEAIRNIPEMRLLMKCKLKKHINKHLNEMIMEPCHDPIMFVAAIIPIMTTVTLLAYMIYK